VKVHQRREMRAKPVKWTEAEKDFLRSNYKRLTYQEIAAELGKTRDQVKQAASRYKITVSRAWPEQEIKILRELYPNTPTQHIADQLGKTLTPIYRMANQLGLKKSDEFNASDASGRISKENRIRRGLEYRFPKGNVPANKGLRRPGWHSGRMKETQFKKGCLSGRAKAIYKPIGAERVTKDGYLQRKVNNDLPFQRRWQMVHRLVWEQHHGPIPDRHLIAFIDGNKLNCAIENLECVSREEWIKRHTIHNYPAPVKEAIGVLRGFRRKLNDYAKKQDSRPAEHAVRNDGATAR
jgi:hypothetical protein